MFSFGTVLFWLPVVFGLMVAAAYVGTTLALRSYFEDERYALSDIVGVDNGDREDR